MSTVTSESSPTTTSPDEESDRDEDEHRRRWIRRAVRSAVGTYLPAIVLFFSLILIWQLVAYFSGIRDYVLPEPSQILVTGWQERADLFSHARVTFREVITGFVIAVSIGWVTAVLISQSKIAERGIYPLVIASQTIPVLAIAPILLIWFGFGIASKVVVVALISYFPVVINTVAGMKSVDRDALYLMQSLGGSRASAFRRVTLPASMPYFFTGVKQASVISVIGAIAGEWVGASRGLGPVMIAANSYLRTELVFAAMLFLSLMAMFMFVTTSIIERLTLRWYFITKEQRTE